MNVFVIGTGRCGTTTFFQACRHATNFTAAHESEISRIPTYAFPDQHIEVSHLLVPAIPHLRARYPGCRFVHLTREREACLRSLRRQCWDEMKAWALEWHLLRHPADVYELAAHYYDRCAELIEALAPDAMRIELERAAEQWPEFWRWIGAEGDLTASLAEWDRAYNPGVDRGRDRFVQLREPPASAPEVPA